MTMLSLWSGIGDLLDFIFGPLIRTLVYSIAAGIYQLIIWLYRIFERLCNSRILDIEILKIISQRIGLILGIIMLFMVVFSVVQLLIEPDKLTDKEKGVGNIVKKVIMVVIMFAFSNIAFQGLYGIQKTIINSNIIAKFILPYEMTEETKENFGGILSAKLFTTFYTFNEDDLGSDVSQMDTPVYDCYYQHAELTNNIVAEADFSVGRQCLNEKTEVKNKNGNETSVYIMNLGFINSVLLLVVGIGTLYFLFSYCLSVGTRTIQLAFLEIISPMAFVSYLSPKKDTMFQKWLKQYFSTYIDVFLRIAIINLAVFLIAVIFESEATSVFWNSISTENSLGKVDSFFIGSFMILAILMFAKKAPDLLKDLFPGSGSKLGLGITSPKKLFDNMLGGDLVPKVATAGAVTAVAGGLTSAASRFRTNWKNGNGFKKSALGAAGGLVSGLGRGLVAGSQKGNVFSNFSKGIQNQRNIDDKYDELVTSGGSTPGRIWSGVTAHFGETKAQEANRRISDLETMSGFYKNIKEQATEFSFVKAAQEQATYAQWDKDNETEEEFRNRKSALEKRVRDLRKASEQAASLGQDTFDFDGQTYSLVSDFDDKVRAGRIKTVVKEANVYADTHNVLRYNTENDTWEKVNTRDAKDLKEMEIYATETTSHIKGDTTFAKNVANDKAAGVNPNGSGKK